MLSSAFIVMDHVITKLGCRIFHRNDAASPSPRHTLPPMTHRPPYYIVEEEYGRSECSPGFRWGSNYTRGWYAPSLSGCHPYAVTIMSFRPYNVTMIGFRSYSVTVMKFSALTVTLMRFRSYPVTVVKFSLYNVTLMHFSPCSVTMGFRPRIILMHIRL